MLFVSEINCAVAVIQGVDGQAGCGALTLPTVTSLATDLLIYLLLDLSLAHVMLRTESIWFVRLASQLESYSTDNDVATSA